MKTLLVVNASGRVTRSVTRRLTTRFVGVWQGLHPRGAVIERDVGQVPSSTVTEGWIAAAFADPPSRTYGMREALRESETIIEEIVSADAIVMGAPMYNFGMPAQLKAYFDQIIRVGRTFAIDPQAENPYQSLLASKPCVIITSVSDGAVYQGGALAHLNFLEPHLKTLWAFIGITDLSFVRVVDEKEDGRKELSLAAAEAEINALARRTGLTNRLQRTVRCAARR